ncbi:MAG: hypothetical protein ABFD16_28985 [Thermoguttaceae bacterium]
MGLYHIYGCLPVWAQHAAVTTYGLYWHWQRFGPGYQRYLQEYAERDRWTAEAWRGWQEERLKDLLTLAAEHVPYYRQAWGPEEKNAARAGRLEGLPLLEKTPVRFEAETLLREDPSPRPRFTFHTAGTTGTPLQLPWTVEELRRSMAVREVRSAGWAGVSFTLPRATFGGRMPVLDPEAKDSFYRFNLVERQVYLSPYHLRPDTAASYAQALSRHRVQWMTGLAVSYYVLARFLLEQKLEGPPMKAVITTSEKLTRNMRAVMEEAYRCRVYEEYGTVESVLLATECEQGRLHVSPDVGVVEILRPDGTPCEPGEVGEVVTTSLLRTCQPLIRYRLGDLAAWDSEPCPCGRGMPVIKEVLGRVEDIVIGPDGRRMVRFHLVLGNQPHVREGQIIQEELDRICVRIAPAPGYGPADTEDIIQRVQRQLGPSVNVTVELVDALPRTKAGKVQMVISHLHNRGWAEAETTGVEG